MKYHFKNILFNLPSNLNNSNNILFIIFISNNCNNNCNNNLNHYMIDSNSISVRTEEFNIEY